MEHFTILRVDLDADTYDVQSEHSPGNKRSDSADIMIKPCARLSRNAKKFITAGIVTLEKLPPGLLFEPSAQVSAAS